MSRRGEVIVALDLRSAEEATALVDRLGDRQRFYKVGLELFTWAGPDFVSSLVERDKKVFLDLKMHDIPNTVGKAARAVAALGVDMVTVHATGGAEMIAAAREGLGDRTRLLAVTILTSFAAEGLGAMWGRDVSSVPEEVLRLATMARGAGADGVVSAASEAPRVRAGLGNDFLLVVPGIRLSGGDRQDQKRVATPAHAVRSGADYLVVGRAITQADDPDSALEAVLADVAAAGGRSS